MIDNTQDFIIAIEKVGNEYYNDIFDFFNLHNKISSSRSYFNSLALNKAARLGKNYGYVDDACIEFLVRQNVHIPKLFDIAESERISDIKKLIENKITYHRDVLSLHGHSIYFEDDDIDLIVDYFYDAFVAHEKNLQNSTI